MTGIIVLAGIGIGITAAVITLLFVFMFDTILKSGERGPKLSSPYEQSLAIEIVAEGLSFPYILSTATLSRIERLRTWESRIHTYTRLFTACYVKR